MKKIMALLVMIFGVAMVVHADTAPNSPNPAVSGPAQDKPSQQNATDSPDNNIQQPAMNPTVNNGADKVGAGSGDDADTINDPDPEADDQDAN